MEAKQTPECPYLITGCGRSGTTWISQLLTELGCETFHEKQFSPYSYGPLLKPESSWLAIPFLDDIPVDTPVLRMIRNPYDVVISTMQLDFQVGGNGNNHDEFIKQMGPEFIINPEDKLTRAIRWVAEWDLPLNDIDHAILKTDQANVNEIRRRIHYLTGIEFASYHINKVRKALGKKVNHKNRRVKISYLDIDDHPEGWRIKERAKEFGYI